MSPVRSTERMLVYETKDEDSNSSQGTKTCSRCKLTKSVDEFPKNKSKKDGLSYYCKICQRVYTSSHYSNNKEYYVKRAKKRNQKVFEKVKKIKENTPCADCGKKYPYYVMDFDHQFGKKFTISSSCKAVSEKKLREEIKKCEVVCSNCHRERTFRRK